MFLGTFDVLKLRLTVCDHEFILDKIKKHLSKRNNLLITPLASQTFVLAYYYKNLKKILDKYDYLFSDSIWVKRSVSFLYNFRVRDRIRGSNLMLSVCNFAQKKRYKIFLYGTTNETLEALKNRLKRLFPRLHIVGIHPSEFKPLTIKEKRELIDEIEQKKTDILMIALGSPLEQIFSYEILYKNPHLYRPMVIIPFGAAFDFISGVKPTAPFWMQKFGIEWFFRLICEPRRLWKRYLIYGPIYVFLILAQKLSLLFDFRHKIIIKSKVRS